MKSFNFSTIIIYFLVCILLTQSFRLSSTDLDQVQTFLSFVLRYAIWFRMNLMMHDAQSFDDWSYETSSIPVHLIQILFLIHILFIVEESSDDNDLSSSTIRRKIMCRILAFQMSISCLGRFCCMHPLSGRKRQV